MGGRYPACPRQEPHDAHDLAPETEPEAQALGAELDERRLVELGYRVERAQDGDRAILRLYRGDRVVLQTRLWRRTEAQRLAEWCTMAEGLHSSGWVQS
ncbi:MAG: hypothetical protein ABIK12_06425 [Pseudomonadota bacterium]